MSGKSSRRRHDTRSAHAEQYRKLYRTARWIRLREAHLSDNPLCELCKRLEIVEEATVVHHKDGGHKGDEDKFWSGPFESLCAPCHDRHGAAEDAGKEIIEFAPDGWPIV